MIIQCLDSAERIIGATSTKLWLWSSGEMPLPVVSGYAGHKKGDDVSVSAVRGLAV